MKTTVYLNPGDSLKPSCLSLELILFAILINKMGRAEKLQGFFQAFVLLPLAKGAHFACAKDIWRRRKGREKMRIGGGSRRRIGERERGHLGG